MFFFGFFFFVVFFCSGNRVNQLQKCMDVQIWYFDWFKQCLKSLIHKWKVIKKLNIIFSKYLIYCDRFCYIPLSLSHHLYSYLSSHVSSLFSTVRQCTYSTTHRLVDIKTWCSLELYKFLYMYLIVTENIFKNIITRSRYNVLFNKVIEYKTSSTNQMFPITCYLLTPVMSKIYSNLKLLITILIFKI